MGFTKFRSLLVILVLSIIWTSQAQATCKRTGAVGLNGNGVIENAAGNNSRQVENDGFNSNSCDEDPDSYGLRFFKLAICKSDPINGDFSTCHDLGDNDLSQGLDHRISPPEALAMDTGAINVPDGDYNFMVAIISNRISITHTQQYANDLRGTTGQGTTCWTVDNTVANTGSLGSAGFAHDVVGTLSNVNTRTAMSWDCGAEVAAAPEPAFTVVASFAEGGTPCDAGFSGLTTIPSTVNGSASGRLLKADNTVATDCENSSRIMWVISFTSPLVVTEKSNFDLAFRTTDGFTIELAEAGGAVDFSVEPAVNAPEAILFTFE